MSDTAGLTKGSVETLISCAARYALGRRTYVVPNVIDIIRSHMGYLQNKVLYVLARDILRAIRESDITIMQKLGWCDLLYEIEDELRRRNVNESNPAPAYPEP